MTTCKIFRHDLIGELDEKKAKGVLEALTAAEKRGSPRSTFELYIESEGGYANEWHRIAYRFLNAKIRIRTVVHKLAYSAAAEIFALGDERAVGEDVDLMYHKTLILTAFGAFTVSTIRKFLEKGDIRDDQRRALSFISFPFMSTKRLNLLELISNAEECNRMSRDFLAHKLRSEVIDELIVEGEDKYLKAREALELGVATKIVSRQK